MEFAFSFSCFVGGIKIRSLLLHGFQEDVSQENLRVGIVFLGNALV